MRPAKPFSRPALMLGRHSAVVKQHGTDPGINRSFNHVRRRADAQPGQLRTQEREQMLSLQHPTDRVIRTAHRLMRVPPNTVRTDSRG